MKKKIKRRIRHSKNPLRMLIPFLILLFIAAALLKLSAFFPNASRIASDTESALQIGTFGAPQDTPSQTPLAASGPSDGNACNHDNGIPAEVNTGKPVNDTSCSCPAFLFECKNKKCLKYFGLNNKKTEHPEDCREQSFIADVPYNGLGILDFYCGLPGGPAPTDGTFCVGKPVIYLYPEKPTLVDVSVRTSGDIVVSDPLYPNDGWKDVLAEPGGKLTYHGKEYRELFYESNGKDIASPQSGLTIERGRLKEQLNEIIGKLGLIGSERQEFLDWWVPRLQALNSPYILFSILTPQEKKKIDHVVYNPEPTTRIEFIAYFKPLSQPFEGNQLDLPSTPPKRVGFTAVEWGGVIDHN